MKVYGKQNEMLVDVLFKAITDSSYSDSLGYNASSITKVDRVGNHFSDQFREAVANVTSENTFRGVFSNFCPPSKRLLAWLYFNKRLNFHAVPLGGWGCHIPVKFHLNIGLTPSISAFHDRP